MMEIFWHLVFCLLSYFLLIQDFPNKTKPYVDIKNKKLQLYMSICTIIKDLEKEKKQCTCLQKGNHNVNLLQLCVFFGIL